MESLVENILRYYCYVIRDTCIDTRLSKAINEQGIGG